MSNLVPSQVVEYIERALPGAKTQADAASPSYFYFSRANAPDIRCLLEMVEGLPGHLVILQGDSLAEYLQAVSAIRAAVNIWESGDSEYQLSKVGGRPPWNPVTLLRKHLLTLPDEAVQPDTNELAFIDDASFREALRRDLHAVNAALQNGEWKAATILGGSLVEALLLDALQRCDAQSPGAVIECGRALVAAGKLKDKPPQDTLDWSMHPMIEVSASLALISSDAAAAARLAKDFRNLIHPGRQLRLQVQCHRGTAMSVVAAIEHTVRCLSR